jgi:hypothetical protein
MVVAALATIVFPSWSRTLVCQQKRQQNTLTKRNATERTREQDVLEYGETGLYRTQWNGMERSATVL